MNWLGYKLKVAKILAGIDKEINLNWLQRMAQYDVLLFLRKVKGMEEKKSNYSAYLYSIRRFYVLAVCSAAFNHLTGLVLIFLNAMLKILWHLVNAIHASFLKMPWFIKHDQFPPCGDLVTSGVQSQTSIHRMQALWQGGAERGKVTCRKGRWQ